MSLANNFYELFEELRNDERYLCVHKQRVEEILFPTGLECEDCEGYDLDCKRYEKVVRIVPMGLYLEV